MTRAWPFALALAMLSLTWAAVASLDRPEEVPVRVPFATFPVELEGGWRGQDLPMDQKVLDILRLTDYVQRVYVQPAASKPAPPVFLYVGYYASQRTGAGYHSPKNCLPGAGWQFADSRDLKVELPGLGTATVTRAVIEKGLEKQVILYWYQDRGRVIPDEYAAKVYLVWDAWRKNRTDGALVRISTDASEGVDATTERAVGFVRAIWPHLQRYMPS